jgi:hypothetical protein
MLQLDSTGRPAAQRDSPAGCVSPVRSTTSLPGCVMFRAVSWAILGMAVAATALFLVVSAVFMPTIAEESIYEPIGN